MTVVHINVQAFYRMPDTLFARHSTECLSSQVFYRMPRLSIECLEGWSFYKMPRQSIECQAIQGFYRMPRHSIEYLIPHIARNIYIIMFHVYASFYQNAVKLVIFIFCCNIFLEVEANKYAAIWRQITEYKLIKLVLGRYLVADNFTGQAQDSCHICPSSFRAGISQLTSSLKMFW